MFYAPRSKWEFKTTESSATYDDIVWNDSYLSKPTEQELQVMYDLSVRTYASNTDFRIERAAAYPSIEQQLDTIYHEGVDVWKQRIQAIKNKYPKPS